MKQFRTVVVCVCALFSMVAGAIIPANAQVPRQISYQGVLTDAVTGKPFTGKHVVTVKLYDSPLGVKPLWVEEHLAGIDNGLFNLTLGSRVPLTLTFNRPYFIGVSVDGKPEISRVPLAAAPYALQAAEAQSLAPNATGAVTSLNGRDGDISLVGSNGIKVENDGGLLRVEFDPTTIKKDESILTTPSGAAGGDLSGTYPNPSIGTAKVTTTKLADASVSTAKVIDGAITSAKITDGTIASVDLAAGAVATEDIAAGAVTTAKILDGTILTADLANGAVQTQIIATDAVMTEKIRDLNVTSPKLADGAVTTLKLANLAVTSAKLADGSVSTGKIVNDAVTSDKLADNSVATNHIINSTIQTEDIHDNAITTPKILDRNVTGKKIWTTNAVAGNVLTFNGTDVVWGSSSGGTVTTFPTPVCTNAFVRFGNSAGTQIKQGSLVLDDVDNGVVPIRASNCSEEGGRLGIALVTRNGGALQASTSGNTRGNRAIDWQMYREEDYEVAGGGYSVIGGGLYNAVIPSGEDGGYAAVVGGGYGNYIEGNGSSFSFIGGGYNNDINSINEGESYDQQMTIAGGYYNTIEGSNLHGAIIGGGDNNFIGSGNSYYGSLSAIVGGTYNSIAGNSFGPNDRGEQPPPFSGPVSLGFIGGGAGNYINSYDEESTSDFSSIVGGEGNLIALESHHSLIGGGEFNNILNFNEGVGESHHSVIGGGSDNYISSSYGFIGGGWGNTVTGNGAIVVGGGYLTFGEGTQYHSNTADGDFSFIGGGADNEVNFDGDYSSVLGGQYNIIGGSEFNSSYSVIPGGRGLTLNGSGSLGFLGGNSNGDHDMTVNATNTTLLANVDLWLANNDNDARELRFYTPNPTGSGTFPSSSVGYTGFVAPNTIDNSSSYQMYSLPQDVPSSGQVLSVSGISGGDVALEWVNQTTPFSLQYFAESQQNTDINSTRYISTWSAIGGADDIDIALSPKGGGALTAHSADATATGGNKRGYRAVDWQMQRNSANQVASGAYSVIGGGINNAAMDTYTTIAGGNDNTIYVANNTANATIGGGGGNTIGGDAEQAADYSTIAGGNNNSITSFRSFIGGGTDNQITAPYSVIGGGVQNTAGYAATVAGGWSNAASNSYATVAGGNSNTASQVSATVAGGWTNTASGQYSAVGGGLSNSANDEYSTIPGGVGLNLASARSFGFHANRNDGSGGNDRDMTVFDNSTAVFGNVDMWLANNDGAPRQLRFYAQHNAAGVFPDGTLFTGFKAPNTLPGGLNIVYSLPQDQPSDGQFLRATNPVNDGNGTLNVALDWENETTFALQYFAETQNITLPNDSRSVSTWSAIGVSGDIDVALSPKGTGALTAQTANNGVTGGNKRGQFAVDWQTNRSAATQVASGNYAVTSGGRANTASGTNSTVGGGEGNNASNTYSTIGGGVNNVASGISSYVGAGQANSATSSFAVVGGGLSNQAQGSNATVGGGSNNTTNSQYATIGGGESNAVGNAASYATIGGGSSNEINANYSTIGGGGENTTNAAFTTIGGGSTNFANGQYSTVGGGALNTANALYSTVGGGRDNFANSQYATIGGGESNGVGGAASHATIGGGNDNQANGIENTIGGGGGNTTSNTGATIAGGSYNTASGFMSSVGGGTVNTVGSYSAIPGGVGLTIGQRSFGYNANHFDEGSSTNDRPMAISASNTAVFNNVDLWLSTNEGVSRSLRFYTTYDAPNGFPGTAKFSGFMAPNTMNGGDDIVYRLPEVEPTNGQFLRATSITGDGSGNMTVLLDWETVSGGSALQYFAESQQNTDINSTRYISTWSAIGTADDIDVAITPKGNGALTAQTADATATGGNKRGTYAVDWQMQRGDPAQVAAGDYSVIGGGHNNRAGVGGLYSTVSGGSSNTASGTVSTVSGGENNTASQSYSTVSGGNTNTASGNHSTVSGGDQNIASGNNSTVGGGQSNEASNNYSTVGGGYNNTVSQYASTVGGGYSSTASGLYSTVGGGSTNTASGTVSTVSGGELNTASSSYTTISGGASNTASAQYSTVGGGYQNTAAGDYSTIPGGRGLTLDLDAVQSFGFLANNNGANDMTISAPNTAVFANTNLWLANNDNDTRELRFYAAQNSTGDFPGAVPLTATKYSSFAAPSSFTANNNIAYTLPATEPTNGQFLRATNVNTPGVTTTVDLEWAAPSVDLSNYYTKTQTDSVINAAMPCGSIVMWTGDINNVPNGWALCDGNNGTPDLNDRFPRGTTNAGLVGNPGGQDSHTHTVDDHAHVFSFSAGSGSGTGTATFTGTAENSTTGITAVLVNGIEVGSGADFSSSVDITDNGHGHTVTGSSSDVSVNINDISGGSTTELSSGVGTGSGDNIPAYRYVGFIMRTCTP